MTEHGAIGLRWMKNAGAHSKATGLYYYSETRTYRYVVGRVFEDSFHLEVRRGDIFDSATFPHWLSRHHRRVLRAMLERFVECMQQSTDALHWMGLAAYLNLLEMLGQKSR